MTPTVTSVYPGDGQMNYTVNEGNSVTFECSATGIPVPVITWLRNRKELIQNDSRVTIRNSSAPVSFMKVDSEIVFEVSRTLTLDNTGESDSGLYECRATNVAGTNTDSFEVIVNVQSTLESFEV